MLDMREEHLHPGERTRKGIFVVQLSKMFILKTVITGHSTRQRSAVITLVSVAVTRMPSSAPALRC